MYLPSVTNCLLHTALKEACSHTVNSTPERVINILKETCSHIVNSNLETVINILKET